MTETGRIRRSGRLQETIRHFAADRLESRVRRLPSVSGIFDWYVKLSRRRAAPRFRTAALGARARNRRSPPPGARDLPQRWQSALHDEARNEAGLRLVAALFPWLYVDGAMSMKAAKSWWRC